MSLWETEGTIPTIDNLIRIKEVFGVTLDEVICADENKSTKVNKISLDTVCAALSYTMGIEAPEFSAEKNYELSNYIERCSAVKRQTG